MGVIKLWIWSLWIIGFFKLFTLKFIFSYKLSLWLFSIQISWKFFSNFTEESILNGFQLSRPKDFCMRLVIFELRWHEVNNWSLQSVLLILDTRLSYFQVKILKLLVKLSFIVPTTHSFHLHKTKTKFFDIFSHLEWIDTVFFSEVVDQSKPNYLYLIVKYQMLILRISTILSY